MTKKDIRQALLQQRLNLSVDEQHHASSRICQHIAKHPAFLNASVVASYIAHKNEINPSPLMDAFPNKTWLFPRIQESLLCFSEINTHYPGKVNTLGIVEPNHPETIPIENISLILVPLVGFDSNNYRLGYGGGYYDRSLATVSPRPTLIGLAYDWQAVDTLPKDPWDIPLDDIITP